MCIQILASSILHSPNFSSAFSQLISLVYSKSSYNKYFLRIALYSCNSFAQLFFISSSDRPSFICCKSISLPAIYQYLRISHLAAIENHECHLVAVMNFCSKQMVNEQILIYGGFFLDWLDMIRYKIFFVKNAFIGQYDSF